MTGQTLYELYLVVFGTPFTLKWDALSPDSRKKWNEYATVVVKHIEIGQTLFPPIPLSVPPDPLTPYPSALVRREDTPDVPLAAGDDCPNCHTPQLPKRKPTDRVSDARACQACGFVQERDMTRDAKRDMTRDAI